MAATLGNTKALWAGLPIAPRVVIPQASFSVNSQAPGTIGTDCVLLYSIPSTPSPDGAYIRKIRFILTSTTGTINSVATLINIFLSTISSGTTSASNTYLYATVNVPAFTIAAVTTAPPLIDISIGEPLPANTHILISQTVAAAVNTAWAATLNGGLY